MDKTSVMQLHQEYRDALNSWSEPVSPLQQHFRNLTATYWPRCRYVIRNHPLDPMQAIICPPYALINQAPNQQHRADYATGVWEGSSAEPQLNANGEICGINVILHPQRMARFSRSLAARGYKMAIPLAKFSQMILDAVAVNGIAAVTEDDGSPTRAYIRPSVGTGVGPWGVALKTGHFIESSVLVFRWSGYFANSPRIDQHGVNLVITGAQRKFPVLGKHASNYGAAAHDGALARQLHYDELLYLAPYIIKDGNIDYNITNLAELFQYGVLADGPGEEIIALAADGETIIYPPMRVNRLGGTVLDYLVQYLLPALNLKSCEADISLEAIRRGELIGLAFVGNAVKVTPIGKIDLRDAAHPDELIATLFQREIHPTLQKIKQRFLLEISGQTTPSDASLLTPVDLAWGDEMRTYLNDHWRAII